MEATLGEGAGAPAVGLDLAILRGHSLVSWALCWTLRAQGVTGKGTQVGGALPEELAGSRGGITNLSLCSSAHKPIENEKTALGKTAAWHTGTGMSVHFKQRLCVCQLSPVVTGCLEVMSSTSLISMHSSGHAFYPLACHLYTYPSFHPSTSPTHTCLHPSRQLSIHPSIH